MIAEDYFICNNLLHNDFYPAKYITIFEDDKFDNAVEEKVFYYQYGSLHRIDGPAIESPSHPRKNRYHLAGKWFPKKKWLQERNKYRS